MMGADVPDAEIEAILGALGFAPRRADASAAPNSPLAVWECRQPSWRQDVTREVDLDRRSRAALRLREVSSAPASPRSSPRRACLTPKRKIDCASA